MSCQTQNFSKIWIRVKYLKYYQILKIHPRGGGEVGDVRNNMAINQNIFF